MDLESVSISEVGRVKEIKQSIVKVEGLQNCMLGQLVSFSNGMRGFVMGFNPSEVLVLFLGMVKGIKAGDEVRLREEFFKVPVGKNFLGRIVNPLCEDLDGKGAVAEDAMADIFREAPAVLDREPVHKMLTTGIRIIDSVLPIGKGQRQLILGDRMTGKTSIAIDSILNQKNKDVVCIYCCIGSAYAAFESVGTLLKGQGALDYTIVVAALASAPIGEQYLAPYSAAALGEYFMYQGKDVLLVFDDLTKHAWAYRELSLLLERPPGREAYPGDVFYLHAQLMERGAQLSAQNGGGSMTVLSIANTLQSDISGFIPTNLISMSDGQIYLSTALQGEGFKPAVDLGLSVSRIGTKILPGCFREITKDLELNHIQYREFLKTTRLRAGITEEMTDRLRHGEKLEKLFIQPRAHPSSIAEQYVLYFAWKERILDRLSDEHFESFKTGCYLFVSKALPELMKKIEEGTSLSSEEVAALKHCLMDFCHQEWESGR